jgi:tRNA 5-methylaminomethyl-2-thiouridine biosynthesis bifunctional protein
VNPSPLRPATLAFDADGLPHAPGYGDVYHPRSGALAQARHVFLGGNGLPQRWQGRERFVVLETGFGLGNSFLAFWQAWREDPQRCERLIFLSVEQHPLTHDDLAAVPREACLRELADALVCAWPPLTPNLHRLAFDDGGVQLLLALGDVQAWLPELVAEVDAFCLDGFAPARNPRMWDERVCKALGRLAAPGATLATWSAAHALRAHLATAGFAVRRGPGQGGKRDITLATFAPPFTPRRAPTREGRARVADRHALIVGAGLAGCAAAWALAAEGWHSTLMDRRAQPADEASGNPAGLFHGIVNAQDGVHARFNRAAALAVRPAVLAALSCGVPGAAGGVLRLETTLDVAQMQALLQRLGLPGDYVRALDAAESSLRAGLALPHPCWLYAGGGWVSPGGLARWYLGQAGPRAELRVNSEVHALRREASGWRLLDRDGRTIAQADTVVLANAGDALRLLGSPDWPIESLRGQISRARASQLSGPRVPIAGSGYLLPEVDGGTTFGATAQRDDIDPGVREADHRRNLAQLARLLGRQVNLAPTDLDGRTAWRCSSVDRLPVIGAVPDADAASRPDTPRLDQTRFVPRQQGLYVFTALGSRGIGWSALGAQLLSAWVTGAPAPLEASMVDAVDPARFVSRRVRRAMRG